MKLDLSSLRRSVYSLEKALQITEAKLDDETVSSDEIELIKAGVIQNFAFAYELWLTGEEAFPVHPFSSFLK